MLDAILTEPLKGRSQSDHSTPTHTANAPWHYFLGNTQNTMLYATVGLALGGASSA
jgi:hypothetical protein